MKPNRNGGTLFLALCAVGVAWAVSSKPASSTARSGGVSSTSVINQLASIQAMIASQTWSEADLTTIYNSLTATIAGFPSY